MSFKEELKVDLNSDEVIKMVKKQERIDFLLDACKNEEKFDALPNDIKNSLEPYRKKIESDQALNIADYENIKEI